MVRAECKFPCGSRCTRYPGKPPELSFNLIFKSASEDHFQQQRSEQHSFNNFQQLLDPVSHFRTSGWIVKIAAPAPHRTQEDSSTQIQGSGLNRLTLASRLQHLLVALRSWFSDAKMATTALPTLKTLNNALQPDSRQGGTDPMEVWAAIAAKFSGTLSKPDEEPG